MKLFDVDEARWRTAWDLKVLGTINMTRAFYPLMKTRGGGVIINVIGGLGVMIDDVFAAFYAYICFALFIVVMVKVFGFS